jgi:UDP-N-acetylmuramate--alanine ligase
MADGIPVLKRAEFISRLMVDQQVIAVAGTHGKTTTTAMIAWMLTALQDDPSYIIGGISANLERNAHAGQSDYFVVEADEYDRMFLGLQPDIAVVTNVEHDHPDCYPTAQDFTQAFDDFVERIQPGGALIACSDDPGAARLLDLATNLNYQVVSYAIDEPTCDYRAQNLSPRPASGFSFDLQHKNRAITPVALQVPGKHNVYNALATLAVADKLGISLQQASKALKAFRGTGRRFEVRGERGGVLVIDDYAHHPTEIRATLSAARARYPNRRIWAVWQPHTYSRTRTLLDAFINAFNDADHVMITEIFAAREKRPHDGFSARQVVAALESSIGDPEKRVIFAPGIAQASYMLLQIVKPGDLVLVLSAGDADQISARLLQDLSARDLTLAGTE